MKSHKRLLTCPYCGSVQTYLFERDVTIDSFVCEKSELGCGKEFFVKLSTKVIAEVFAVHFPKQENQNNEHIRLETL